MIQDKATFNFNGVKIDANYSVKSKPCKTMRITIGEEVGYISREDLFALMVLFADEKQIADCVKAKPFKTIKKMIKVKAKQDFKKGDDIIFPINYEVTPEVADAYYEMEKNREIAEDKAKKMINNIFKK